MVAKLKTRILTDPVQLRAISSEWVVLYGRCPGATPFQRPEWIISWAETFSPECIRLIEVRSGNTLVGIAPFLIYPRGEKRVLAFMAGGISDYLDLLVDFQHENEVMSAIFQAIEELDRWTILDLTDLPSNSILHRCMPGELTTPHDQCSSLRLPATRGELLQHLSRRQRANLRQAHSRIQKAGVELIEISTQETLDEFLHDLFRLHTMRWLRDGEPGVLEDERVKAFHRKVAPGLHAEGVLRLHRLRLREQTIAVMYTLRDCATVFCYLQGYDPAFAALSPGTYLMFSVMENAILSGITKLDLLRGKEGYKQHWRVEEEVTGRIQRARSSENNLLRVDSTAA